MALTDLYVLDKHNGQIHRVGDNCHDSIWVDDGGIVHYQNLQNGDGCSGNGHSDGAGYEFVASDCGEVQND